MTALTTNQKILTSGESGNVKIRHFQVSKQSSKISLMQSISRGHGSGAFVPPGGYVSLLIDGELTMSDTPYELSSTQGFVDKAHGHVLITGLGLGLVVMALFKNKKVKSVTVIEKNVHVIRLTYPRVDKFLSEKYHFVVSHADAFTWDPINMLSTEKIRWNCILHDIWPTINDLNLPDMARLKRRYAHWLDKSDPDRFQRVWGQRRARWMRKMIRKAKDAGLAPSDF